MRHGLAHFARLLSLLTAIGGATWAGFSLISTSNHFGNHHPEEVAGPKIALGVAGVAALIYIALGLLLRGDD